MKACIESGTDYLDISGIFQFSRQDKYLKLCRPVVPLLGEPEFIERMSLEYHEKAVAAGVTVVSAAVCVSNILVMSCK